MDSLDNMEDIYLSDGYEAGSDWDIIGNDLNDPSDPNIFTNPPDFAQSAGFEHDDTDSEEDYRSEALENSRPGPKPGGYAGRIEQILYEKPNLPILITEAGKGSDGTKYIVYTIRTGVSLTLLDLFDSADHSRIWKYADVTQNSHPSETLSQGCTQLS